MSKELVASISRGDAMKKLEACFDTLGLSSDATLLVHSSFKRCAQDGYRAEDILGIFCEYFSSGSLLMPTMSWRFVKREQPVFDVAETPSNTGILTELYRKQPGVIRSLHPSHSVCGRGVNVADIISTHHESLTPCDKKSPFARLVELDADILMFGIGMDCCTLIHHVEEIVAPEHYVKESPDEVLYRCIDLDRNEHKVQLRRHKFLPRNYWQFQDRLAYEGRLKSISFDNTLCIHYKARDLFQVVESTLSHSPDAIIAKPGDRFRMM